MKNILIGLDEALKLTLDTIAPLETETVPLDRCFNRAAARDLTALVDSPSVDAALKDGYAVRAEEVHDATPEHPVELEVVGVAAAGGDVCREVFPGTAVRILTGGRVPPGANAVVAEEFTDMGEETVRVFRDAGTGRNILSRGSDVAKGESIISSGTRLSPGIIGILAAAGYGKIPVIRSPRVAIVATGDEVVAPGKPLPEGKLFASNLVTLKSWCMRYGMETTTDIVSDDQAKIKSALGQLIETQDALLTSGGAWTGDRDFVVGILDQLGWRQCFHRVRIGPGKAVGFGMLRGKPVFVLPGGPPSNLLGFLEIALPGLLKLAGFRSPELPRTAVKLVEDVSSRHGNWTQFIFGTLEDTPEETLFYPLTAVSRLQSMAWAEGVISIPEGQVHIPSGTRLPAQILL